jgi:hypothetical protein
VRWLFLALLTLLTLALLAGGVAFGAWWWAHREDAPKRPVPAVLALPAAGAPNAAFVRTQSLLAPAAGGQRLPTPAAPLSCAPGADCATQWLAEPAALARELQSHTLLASRCEAVLAAGRYTEPLPARLTPDTPLPDFSGMAACATLFAGQALVAAERDERAAALAALRKSRAWAEGQLQGARTLIGTMIAFVAADRHQRAVQAVALRRPGWAGSLLPLLAPWPAGALDPARWMPAEAAFSRGAVDAFDDQCHPERAPGAATEAPPVLAEPDTTTWTERLGKPVLMRLCRWNIGWLPEATRQRFDDLWVARVARAQAGVEAWIDEAALAPRGGSELGWSTLRWRNTLGEAVFTAANGLGDGAFDAYVARAADIELQRRAVAVLLAVAVDAVPSAQRAGWWVGQARADTRSFGRLRLAADGRSFEVEPWMALFEPNTPRGQRWRVALP